MQCPVCKTTTLQLSERQQVEIDYCPDCRGVWLDRGELDKIIERSEPQQQPSNHNPPYRHEGQDHSSHHKSKYNRKKRSSFLGELFDF
ncbi:TFIIB-type zinc ribbon-containing protein [Piscirickettsia litoralis]|uniref:Transcription factor zinc-finger domain-containing protein n=1 Tax=Piscirickettsia litoralis TaxID=1891921 RepID=A0ABX3A1T4_9GAMM|nr:zf-TFIIB domain-containing protein [Piscirickettsia litoralis]ODN41588.1 hypothetical protein BGC07_15925 [Piscirickettsia litoralis]